MDCACARTAFSSTRQHCIALHGIDWCSSWPRWWWWWWWSDCDSSWLQWLGDTVTSDGVTISPPCDKQLPAFTTHSKALTIFHLNSNVAELFATSSLSNIYVIAASSILTVARVKDDVHHCWFENYSIQSAWQTANCTVLVKARSSCHHYCYTNILHAICCWAVNDEICVKPARQTTVYFSYPAKMSKPLAAEIHRGKEQLVVSKVECPTRHTTCHFGDESIALVLIMKR